MTLTSLRFRAVSALALGVVGCGGSPASRAATPPAAAGDAESVEAAPVGPAAGSEACPSIPAIVSAVDGSPSSVLLRSTHVVRVQVDEIEVGAPVESGAASNLHAARMRVHLERALVGSVAEPEGAPVVVDVRLLVGPGDVGDWPGVWAAAEPEVGQRLIVFSRAASDRLSELLADDEAAVIGIDEAAEVEPDLCMALTVEARRLGLGDALAFAEGGGAHLGWVFPEYLWARFGAELSTDSAAFGRFMSLAESPSLGRTGRVALWRAAYDAQDSLSADNLFRLARGLFLLLASGLDDEPENLISVVLPNLLGLRGGPPGVSADAVFADLPAERAAARAALEAYRGSADPAPLSAWLR